MLREKRGHKFQEERRGILESLDEKKEEEIV